MPWKHTHSLPLSVVPFSSLTSFCHFSQASPHFILFLPIPSFAFLIFAGNLSNSIGFSSSSSSSSWALVATFRLHCSRLRGKLYFYSLNCCHYRCCVARILHLLACTFWWYFFELPSDPPPLPPTTGALTRPSRPSLPLL